jgi:hypothetical protein
MNRKSCVIIVVAVILMILVCSKSGDDYYPLAVGNTWVYVNSLYGVNDTTIEMRYIEIIKRVPDSARMIWLQETRHVRENVEYVDTLYIEDCGDTLWGFRLYSYDTLYYILMILPLIPGQQWSGWEVIGHEDVTVPAGTFTDCVIVNWDTEYKYYAPNVGLIKERYEIFQNSVSVLETYDVK